MLPDYTSEQAVEDLEVYIRTTPKENFIVMVGVMELKGLSFVIEGLHAHSTCHELIGRISPERMAGNEVYGRDGWPVENENYLKDVISVVGGNAALGMRRVFHIRCSLNCLLGMRLVPPDQQGMQDPWVGSDLTLNYNDSDSSTMYSVQNSRRGRTGAWFWYPNVVNPLFL